jgi:hypothetical protein
MSSLGDTVLNFLQAHHVMTLATDGPQGLWAAAVFYVNDGFTLTFLSSPASRHSQNIEATGRVAATIQEETHDWRAIQGVQLEGKAERLGGEEQVSALLRYGQKFPLVGNLAAAPAEIVKAMSRIAWYKITPERLYFVDNSRGFGHRDEVQLNDDV